MFSFSRLLVASSLALAAVAWNPTTTVTDTAVPTATTVSQCNVVGGAQCCSSTATAGSVAGLAALAAALIDVADLNEVIGIDCSPLTVGQSCSGSPVCCENNAVGNGISVGCVPVTIVA